MVATYTNGRVRNIARLALADFANLNGLERKGSTLYQATPVSGAPLLNKPGVGGAGTVSGSMLEESNVDLADEFVNMIVIQRGYQANSKVISDDGRNDGPVDEYQISVKNEPLLITIQAEEASTWV